MDNVSSVRKRQAHAKRRSGCRTCKLRRVRCDEAEPECQNCVRRDLACDGYLPRQPFNILALADPVERHCFQYFHMQTRPQLSSLNDFDFWDRLALQRSYSEETIRQLVAAIGAYHEALETDDSSLHLIRLDLASRLYLRMISRLVKVLGLMDLSDVLMACILLAFLDNIRGDIPSAYMHISGARAVLEEHRHAETSQWRSLIVTKILAPIIANLGIVVDSLLAPSPSCSLETRCDVLFVSFLEAYDCLCDIVGSFIRETKAVHATPVHEYTVFSRVESWWERLSRSLQNSGSLNCKCHWPDCHAHRMLGALHLEIVYLTTRARLHCAWTGLETTLDLYEPSYHRVLDACAQMAQILNTSSTNGNSTARCLGFRVNYFQGCWMVAEECRDPSLRRRAISILRRWHYTHHLYDTLLVADTAESLVRREEMGSLNQPTTTSQDLPESCRIRFLVATFFELDPRSSALRMVWEAARCEFIKISILRRADETNKDLMPEPHESSRLIIEALWVDRRKGNAKPHGYDFRPSEIPVATGGLFPQAATPLGSRQSKLWSRLRETRNTETLLQERRWGSVIAPVDRVEPLGAATTWPSSSDHRSKSKETVLQSSLQFSSSTLRKKIMGASLHTIVHETQ
jgi:hypothetical protein